MNTPAEIAKNYLATGKAKVSLPINKMFVLAILAGIYIGLAGMGATVAPATITNASVAKLVGACIFPTGLTLVVLAGSELFTGNCLLTIPLLNRDITLRQTVASWAVVYAGNFIGGLLVAAAVVYGHSFDLFGNGLAVSAIRTATAKCSMTFGDAFLRGLLCNLLVCLAVWLTMSAKDAAGKILGLFLPIMLFVLCGYEHCVANMYYIPAGLLAMGNPTYAQAAAAAGVDTGMLSWTNYFIAHLLPVTLGNMAGGCGIGALYWWIYLGGKKS